MATTQFTSSTDPFGPLFEDFLRSPGWSGRGMLRSPEADVVETQGEILVMLDAPGLAPDDIELSLENNVLTVSGERRPEWTQEQGNSYKWHLAERRHGKFSRSFILPRDVDQEQIQARFHNGVLSVVIPKSERARRRRIEIRNADGRADGNRIEVGDGAAR